MNPAIYLTAVLCLLLTACDLPSWFPTRVVTNVVYAQVPAPVVYPPKSDWSFTAGDVVAFREVADVDQNMFPGVAAVTINPGEAQWGFGVPGVSLFVRGEPYKVIPRHARDRPGLELSTWKVSNLNNGQVLYRRYEYAFYKVDHVRVLRTTDFESNP